MKNRKNILICPLEWGLGHAARMIPLAKRLSDMNNNVIIASGEEHLSLFRTELPGLTYLIFPGFKPGYSAILPQYLFLLGKIPSLLYHIFSEHLRLKKIIEEYDIDIIISDNRFGLWNKDIKSVYVTHMPLIPLPKRFKFLEHAGVLLHRKIISRYTYCFIPDLPGDLNLSGRLSHGLELPDNVRFIGILSRFTNSEENGRDMDAEYPHYTVILSGPEPQKGILKDKLVALLKDKNPVTIIFEGLPGKTGETGNTGHILFYGHLPASAMKKIIETSEKIITRSGYTTLMELVSMNCTALIIPTPGQTEQEYLAEYLTDKGWFSTVSQEEIKAGMAISAGEPLRSDEINRESSILLTKALNELLEDGHKES